MRPVDSQLLSSHSLWYAASSSVEIQAAASNVAHHLVFGEIRDHGDPTLLWYKEKSDEVVEFFFHPM